jgi:hypothetical protein
MRIVVIIILLLAAHFNLTAFAPAQAGKATFYWPFAADSKSWLSFIGGLPQQSGLFTTLLASIAGLGFLAAAFALLGWIVPEGWWLPSVLIAAIASIALYVLYFGGNALIPIALDAVLLWGVIVQGWTVAGLHSA